MGTVKNTRSLFYVACLLQECQPLLESVIVSLQSALANDVLRRLELVRQEQRHHRHGDYLPLYVDKRYGWHETRRLDTVGISSRQSIDSTKVDKK